MMALDKLKITTKYPNDVVMVPFSALETWDLFICHIYSLERVGEAVAMLQADKKLLTFIGSEMKKDWQSATKLLENSLIDEGIKHSLRIAWIAIKLCKGSGFKPVSIDTYSQSFSKISDGNHRTAAIRYLGCKELPAYLSGIVDDFQHLMSTTTI